LAVQTELHGKVAVVTGAGRGIGRAIALGLARAGADVTVLDRDEAAVQSVGVEIESLGAHALSIQADITSSQQVDEALRRVAAQFNRLDIMVNNAGMGHVKPLLDITEQEWDLVFAVNTKGVLFGIQSASRVMIDKKLPGRIINIASVAGKGGRPLLAAYAASKAAVISVTQSAAFALAPHGIAVNCVCPGYAATTLGISTVSAMKAFAESGAVPTEQSKVPPAPLGDEVAPEDISQMVTYLAGPGGVCITGQAINVDGGRCMH